MPFLLSRISRFSLSALSICILSSCGHAQTTRIEAEAEPAAGDLKILDLPEASGGKAVSLPRDWNPIFIAAPPEQGEAFTVWVRYKDKPILLKAATKDGQKDLGWQWDSPTELTWKRAGRWKREEIGDNLVIIRAGDGGQGPVLDCVTFATDDIYDPNIDTAAAPKVMAQNKPAINAANNAANITEGAAVALGMQDAPNGQFFEAEAYSSANVVAADGASGAKAVKSDNDWQPLIVVPLSEGDAWKVWVRHKGGPFTIKTKSGDRWFWNKPGQFSWTETDVFSRDELGGKNLVIGRDGGGKQPDTVQIDAVVLAPDKKRELPADKPDTNAAPRQMTASIDWNAKVGAFPAALWGINEHESVTNGGATPAFQKLLGGLDSPLIRIHYGGFTDAWTDAAKRDWDVEKIKRGIAASTGYGDAKLMVNIASWPAWISKNTVLTPSEEAEFAALCARLVKVFRDDVKRPVAYWEITNELDNNYEKAGQLDRLWELYNQIAAAIRKEDPKAKLGGPAFTWAKPLWVEGFLKNCPDVQFVTWHNYGTGDLYESNEKVFEAATSNVGGNARSALDLIRKYDNGRRLETFLTEYNVKYTWDPYERRHQNQVGSLFQALVVHEMGNLGLTGATLWQQHGKAYGSLIDSNQTFPSYTLFTWGPKYLSGTQNKATTGDKALLELLPVTRKDGQKSLLILNKASGPLILPSANTLLPGFKVAQQINSDRVQQKLEVPTGQFAVPGYSLTLLTSATS